MPKTIIQSDQAPAPIGPYNQAVEAGGALYTSGQIPLDPATGELAGPNIEAQTRQVLRNLEAVLGAGGYGLHDVVKTTIYLRDMNDFARVNEIYREAFGGDGAPARTTIQVARLPMDAGIEIECVAQR